MDLTATMSRSAVRTVTTVGDTTHRIRDTGALRGTPALAATVAARVLMRSLHLTISAWRRVPLCVLTQNHFARRFTNLGNFIVKGVAAGSAWHAHEMAFGFAPTVLAGFLLTGAELGRHGNAHGRAARGAGRVMAGAGRSWSLPDRRSPPSSSISCSYTASCYLSRFRSSERATTGTFPWRRCRPSSRQPICCSTWIMSVWSHSCRPTQAG